MTAKAQRFAGFAEPGADRIAVAYDAREPKPGDLIAVLEDASAPAPRRGLVVEAVLDSRRCGNLRRWRLRWNEPKDRSSK